MPLPEKTDLEILCGLLWAMPLPSAVAAAENGQILAANTRLLDLLGYQAGELIGHSMLELGAWQDLAQRMLMMERLRTDGLCDSLPVDIVTKNGQIIPVLFSATLISVQGRMLVLSQIVDLRLQRQLEESLHQSEERLRTVYQASPLGIVLIASEDNRILQANPAFQTMIGYAEAELRQLTIGDLTEPEDFAVERLMLDAVREGQTTGYRTDRRFIRKDGHVLWGNVSSAMVYQPDGSPSIAVEIVEDISYRRWTEALLREREEKFRAIFDSSPLGIGMIDVNTLKITQANAAFCNWLGYSPDQLVRLTIQDILYPEDFTQEFTRLRDLLSAPVNRYRSEKRYWRQDGSLVWGALTVALVLDQDGQPAWFLGVMEDISDRKSAEAALLASEQRYHLIFNQMLDGFALHEILCDADGHPNDYRFLEVNPAFERLTGLRAADILGRRVLEVLPATEPYWIETYGRVALTGEPADLENYAAEIGKTYEVRVFCPQIGRFAVIFRDVSERKRAEEQIQASLQEKEVMLREIHHRVKNNLQVIISLIDLQASTVTDVGILDIFKELQGRTRTMALVHESLYRSHSLAKVDFDNYLHNLVSFLTSSYAGHYEVDIQVNTVEVFLDVETAIPCGLIVNELVTNALKYAFPNRQAVVARGETTCEVHIDLAEQADTLVLNVYDNGIGLPPDLDWQNTSSLGLQLVNILTHQLNGRISLKRAGGTCFCIMFPRSRETASS